MGRTLLSSAASDARFSIVGATERPGSPFIGKSLSFIDADLPSEFVVSEAVDGACGNLADVWIDFTSPSSTIDALATLQRTKVNGVIIGTTGFDEAQRRVIQAASEHLAIVQSGNFSLGVNLLAGLVRQAAARLGPDWDIEVLESHHRHKVDAPSGTALMMGRAAATGRGVSHDDVARFNRHGQTGPRVVGEIGYAVLRAGGIIGDHEVMFASQDEIVTLTHKAASRTIFAKGALAAAAWVVSQKPGLYSMDDVLGL
jgi:4-hydroxy-tetrahydrodipicolinate reductase